MGRYSQNVKNKGSQKYIQKLINFNAPLINQKITEVFNFKKNLNIDWFSPLINDHYAEYRDEDFLNRLGLDSLNISLKKFWPSGGPQWDALAMGDGNIFLVEAKSYIGEILSPPSGAKNPASLKLINKSLSETKSFVGSKTVVDWSSYFYQYTNRIAHLYFLRELSKENAFMVFIYFLSDNSVNGPETKEEWLGAISIVKKYLGINQNKLSPFIRDIFIDVKELK